MKRTVFSILVVCSLLFQNVSGVYAADFSSEDFSSEEEYTDYQDLIQTSDSDDDIYGASDLDNDYLFASYVDEFLDTEMFAGPQVSLMSMSNAGNNLSGIERLIYDKVVADAKKIAAGEKTSSIITITLEELGVDGYYYAEDLNVEAIVINNALNHDVITAMYDKISFSDAVWAALYDCPFELFWFDKTCGYATSRPSLSYSENRVHFKGALSIKLAVGEEYSTGVKSAFTSSKEAYLDVNPAIASALTSVKAKSASIVTKYSEKTRYEKVLGYADEICALTDYNHEAASSSYSGGYGNPWQLLYVFDGDSSTKVVCEGYSKAMQYLCELGDVKCTSVSGEIVNLGPHMWNIITLKGKNYLTDVTNSDNGAECNNMFILKGTTGSVNTGYAFSGYKFAYDEDMLDIYSESELTLASSDYDDDEETCPDGHTWDDGTVAVEPGCVTEGTMKYICSVCDEIKTEAIDALGHNFSSEWTIDTPASCTADGEKSCECTVCHEKKTETIDALGHSFSEEWTVDAEASCTADGSKSHHCVREANGCTEKSGVTVIPKLNHSWDDGTETTPATCTLDGEMKYECKVCHDTKVETIDALDHSFSEEWTVDEEATCTADGSKSHHCVREANGCTEKSGETVIPKLDHNWDDGEELDAATCTTSGSIKYKCQDCSEETTETVDALGHSYSEEMTVDEEPTCTDKGSQSYHCTRTGCDAKTGDTEIPTVPHSWNDGIEITPATCTEDGEMEYECTVCHDTKTETIAAKGHREETLPAVVATCTKAGKTAGKKCGVCEEILVAQNDVAALGHVYSKSWTVDKAATYTATGSKSYHCTRSGCTAKSTVTVIQKLNAITGTASYTKTYSASAQPFTLDLKAKNGKLSYVPNTSKVTVKSGKVTITKGFCGVAKITVKASGSDCATATKVITITVKPATAKISTLKNSAKGTAAITWTKQSYVTGYEINYSTNSSFAKGKTINITKNSTISKSITKLTKGKTYYFRIRAYKTVSGKKVYGAYSSKKSIKITK